MADWREARPSHQGVDSEEGRYIGAVVRRPVWLDWGEPGIQVREVRGEKAS